jgi:SAM-dependent methyltransferase
MRRYRNTRAEFGDFQTPLGLAREVCSFIARTGFSPASVLEPTCGLGAFIQAAVETFPGVSHVVGMDRDARYVQQAREVTARAREGRSLEIREGDFFDTDWCSVVGALPDPILILGNPPWVTNAALSTLGSANLPAKSNIDNLRGIDALTGKSNFDISEWMLRENLRWLSERHGMLAVLCKTAVARKVLLYAWSRGLPIESSAVHRLDAKRHFGASVDACLLVVTLKHGGSSKDCRDYGGLSAADPDSVFGLRDGALVASVGLYERWRHLSGRGLSGWRSGIKHDCSGVFELCPRDSEFENGLGERVGLEPDVVFPLLKSSDLAANRVPWKRLLVPQTTMTATPEGLQYSHPKAWKYLIRHEAILDKRGSSIYRNRPRFSIFGVGPYSFSPWKVAISGLHKKLEFIIVPPFQDRPVVLDDTCYLFPCQSEEECRTLERLVTSEPAREFWSAFIFWDSKRPITAQILNRLDLAALTRELGEESSIARTLAERQLAHYTEGAHQQLLFRESAATYGSGALAGRRGQVSSSEPGRKT